MHKVAENLLEKFGTFGTLTTKGFTVPDATKPWDRTATPTDNQILMTQVPWSKSDVGRYFSEDIISATTKAIILWDDDVPVKVDDEITYLGNKWMVKAIKPINPAGTGLIRVCALSGGE
jgi:hypothetical protein